MPDYLPPVVAKLTGDDSGLTRTLASSKEKVRRWAADIGRIDATIRVDAKLKDGTLAELRRRVNDGAAARMRVDLELGAGQREALRQSLADREIEAKVKPVVDQVALRRVQAVLRDLGKRIDVRVRPAVETAAQRRAETRLNRLSQNRTVLIRTRVIGGGSGGTTSSAASNVGALRTLISLAPALVPIAAEVASAAVSVAASLGAATLAVGTFGAAVIPQLKRLGDVSAAQTRYNDAVSQYGPHSQQATAAQDAMARSLGSMPPATQRAAMGFLTLKSTFKAWSDDLAKFTLAPVTKSFAVVEAMLPGLTPMVKGTSAELDRLVTLAGGAVASPGFDAFSKRLADFTTGVLQHAVNDIAHFSRALSEGNSNGPVSKFMQYAKEEGPAVRKALDDIASAVSTVLQGASQAGPGMLTLVDAVARLVAALPPEFVGRVMQAYAAFRLFKLANTGVTALSAQVTTLSVRLTELRAASVAAGGGVAGARAAIASIGTTAKVAGAVAVVAGLALAMKHFSDESKKAKISAADMATSLAGVASGDAASLSKLLGQLTKDSDNLHQSLMQRLHSNDSVWDIITNSGGKASAAKKDFKELGDTLADMVKAGEGDRAAAVLDKINAAGVKVPTKYLKDYKSALADAAFESKLAAQSQGIFGQQALSVQKRLDAQKSAAQGLQQAILDLNDANRAGLDAESDYQQAIDDATAAIKGHRDALKMSNGQLDLGTQAARDAYKPLSNLAATAEAAATAAIQQGKGQDYANGILVDAHHQLVKTAEAMGLNSQDARRLADSLDNIHDPKIQVSVATRQAQADIAAAKKALASLPAQKTAALRADAAQLKNVIRDAQARINAMHGKSIVIRATYSVVNGKAMDVYHEGGGYADGALIAGRTRHMAAGGMGRPAMMARGGSNVLWAEGPDESYIPHDRRPRSRAIAEQTVAIMGGAVSWDGKKSATSSGGNIAQGLAIGITGGRADVIAATVGMGRAAIAAFNDELGIASPSKKFRSLGAYVTAGLVQGLTGSTSSVRAATKKIASMLYVDLGSHDRGLQRYVARESAALLRLATQRDSVATKLKAAQSKLAGLQKQWTDERNQVASGILQNTSIVTAAPQSGFAVSAADVVNNLRDQAGKAAQFAAQLQALKKMGLRADLIAQIAAAGADQGGATAAALAGAGKGTIDQLNSIQKGLTSSANSTGAAVADAMYGAGIKSAQGLVKGLRSQEKAIEAQMLRIAKSMQAAIKKALGIHSPSRVMAELGEYTARGMAVGIARGTKHVQIAASGMAMAARQSAAITGGGGGGAVYHYEVTHIHVAGHVLTEKKLVDVVEQAYLNRARRNSLTYPSYRR